MKICLLVSIFLIFLPLLCLAYVESKDLSPVVWMAPFYSGGGYCSEAIAFVSSLQHLSPDIRLKIIQHGDSYSRSFVNSLDEETSSLLSNRSVHAHFPSEKSLGFAPESAIYICHSEPGAWYVHIFIHSLV